MPRRSRGCQACRQRRIGCDGTLPSCRQCLITHRRCSGPVRGPIIINQTDIVTSRHGQASSASRQQTASSMIRQPSPTAIVSLALISQFICFLTSANEAPSKRPWLYALNDISLAERGPVLDLALQAAATVFCGVTSKNRAAVMEACHLYGKALSWHSNTISQVSGTSITSKICTSVILSLFEAIWPTNSAAYAVHLAACGKMLGSAGLELEENAVLRQVAVHVQYQALFAMTTTPRVCQISTLEAGLLNNMTWVENSESYQVADRLMIEVFKLQRLLSRSCYKNDNVMKHPYDIDSRIGNLWVEYQEEANQLGKPIELPSSSGPLYRDAFTAMTITYFAAARILLHTVSYPQVAQHPGPSGTMDDNGRLILNCSSFLMQKDIGCAYLRMFLPLTLVARYSASSEQYTLARTLLECWLCRTPFSGLSSIALKQVHSAQAKNSSVLQ